ncbi:hypothetical protein Airi02_057000 [Actinoallomurus iriomotensis]|uniref:Uncharacterized protein n=1 Tax=Actinoallomurus iriomotensis TaxID=478107 RepID=A0A9W6W3A6_9ACTN|nr:hypothetical protein Airi02_057000 [Actinoallomurus iriomotensis]
MVIKADTTTCHAHGCTRIARWAYKKREHAIYCSATCRRNDIAANRGKPWESQWARARAQLALWGRYRTVQPPVPPAVPVLCAA